LIISGESRERGHLEGHKRDTDGRRCRSVGGVTTADTVEGIGRRVKNARKLASLTQHQLAEDARVSLSLVKKVELGHMPASPAFTAAVARALGLGTTELTDQPYQPRDREEHRVHSVIPALRREIAAYLLPPGEGVRPRPLEELAAAVAHASMLRQSAALDALGIELLALLAELCAGTHVYEGKAQQRVFGLLAEAYAAAGQVAYKLGYADLASLTTERVEWAAGRSGDPLAVAAGEWCRAGELIATAEWRGALVYLDAARADDSATGDAHLAEAKAIAAHIPLGADHYRLAFDPDSVRIWGVGLAVERRDGIEAVKRAALLPRSRRARRANGSVTTGLILLEDSSCTATAPGHRGRFRSPETPRRCRPATISAGSRNDHHAGRTRAAPLGKPCHVRPVGRSYR
jgi:transcriptional regulator with XRE-family HTH domain